MDTSYIALASSGWETPVILFSLLAFFGLIVVGVILAKKHIKGLQSKDDKPIDEEKAVEEELNRVLRPVEDEKIKEEMLKAAHEQPAEKPHDEKKH
ncbi:MAG: hypothetical protein WC282_04350 [Bacilli bacterium]|jgi:uncharacterized protein YneF (UPF0154 family)